MGKIKHICKECGEEFETYLASSTFCSRWCRGKLTSRTLKGITYVKRYGKEKAVEIKRKLSKKKIGKLPINKGKTLVEVYGVKRAEEIRTKMSVAHITLPIFQHICKGCGINYENRRELSSFCSYSCTYKNKEWTQPFARSGTQWKKDHVPWNKGKQGEWESPKRGKTIEELYGAGRAKILRERMRKVALGRAPYNKGRSLKVLHGEEKANRIRETSRLSHLGKSMGELNPAWKGGISFEPYGPKFSDKLRAEIRARDGFKCVECGWTEEQLRKKLDVHHIDFNKQNNSPENLVCLCRPCHAQTQFGREQWTNYFQQKVGGD